jgi:hypothetical protein
VCTIDSIHKIIEYILTDVIPAKAGIENGRLLPNILDSSLRSVQNDYFSFSHNLGRMKNKAPGFISFFPRNEIPEKGLQKTLKGKILQKPLQNLLKWRSRLLRKSLHIPSFPYFRGKKIFLLLIFICYSFDGCH